MKKAFLSITVAATLALTGCSSISKGVAEAVLEHESEDTRICDITAMPFTGVRQSIEASPKTSPNHSTKILMVHGISKHMPGYSTPLRSQLSRSLGMGTIEKHVREISLSSPNFKHKDGTPESLGTLLIYRYMDESRQKEFLFYELTWSPITEERKSMIAYDDSVANTYRRAGINEIMKRFVNNTVPDLLIYMDAKHDQINEAVGQSVCWMFQGDWDALPPDGLNTCSMNKNNIAKNITDDDYFFITHSLGSRITIDTIQNFANTAQGENLSPNMQATIDAMRDKDMTVFMLANQLPLLQMATDEPRVTKQMPNYCGPNAPFAKDRIFKNLRIVAFSDPNDILSYPVPPRFAADHMDSRICPEVANINLNIAPVRDLFGATDFADPLTAHNDYMTDDRVIGLIADGISRTHQATSVATGCEWTEISP